MKITEGQLRRIIRQEVQALQENQPWPRNAWPRPSASTHSYPPISDDVRASLYGAQEPMDPADLMGDLEVALDNRENPAEIADFMRAEGLTPRDVQTANPGLYSRLDAVGVFDML